MSVTAIPTPGRTEVKNPERLHRFLLKTAYVLTGALILGVSIYGFDYYLLDSIQRVFSSKHHLLRSSGPVGLGLGILGTILFCNIFLYAVRKHWAWLRRFGSTRHWLDFHVLMAWRRLS